MLTLKFFKLSPAGAQWTFSPGVLRDVIADVAGRRRNSCHCAHLSPVNQDLLPVLELAKFIGSTHPEKATKAIISGQFENFPLYFIYLH